MLRSQGRPRFRFVASRRIAQLVSNSCARRGSGRECLGRPRTREHMRLRIPSGGVRSLIPTSLLGAAPYHTMAWKPPAGGARPARFVGLPAAALGPHFGSGDFAVAVTGDARLPDPKSSFPALATAGFKPYSGNRHGGHRLDAQDQRAATGGNPGFSARTAGGSLAIDANKVCFTTRTLPRNTRWDRSKLLVGPGLTFEGQARGDVGRRVDSNNSGRCRPIQCGESRGFTTCGASARKPPRQGGFPRCWIVGCVVALYV